MAPNADDAASRRPAARHGGRQSSQAQVRGEVTGGPLPPGIQQVGAMDAPGAISLEARTIIFYCLIASH